MTGIGIQVLVILPLSRYYDAKIKTAKLSFSRLADSLVCLLVGVKGPVIKWQRKIILFPYPPPGFISGM